MYVAAQLSDHAVADMSCFGTHERSLLQAAIDARSLLRRKNGNLFFAEKIEIGGIIDTGSDMNEREHDVRFCGDSVSNPRPGPERGSLLLFKMKFKADAVFEYDNFKSANAYLIGEQVMTHIIFVRLVSGIPFKKACGKQGGSHFVLLSGHAAGVIIVDVGTQSQRRTRFTGRFGRGVVG